MPVFTDRDVISLDIRVVRERVDTTTYGGRSDSFYVHRGPSAEWRIELLAHDDRLNEWEWSIGGGLEDTWIWQPHGIELRASECSINTPIGSLITVSLVAYPVGPVTNEQVSNAMAAAQRSRRGRGISPPRPAPLPSRGDDEPRAVRGRSGISYGGPSRDAWASLPPEPAPPAPPEPAAAKMRERKRKIVLDDE